MPSPKRNKKEGSIARLRSVSQGLYGDAAKAVSRLDDGRAPATPDNWTTSDQDNTPTVQTAAWATDRTTGQQDGQLDNRDKTPSYPPESGQLDIWTSGQQTNPLKHFEKTPFIPKQIPPLDLSRKPEDLTSNQFRTLHYIYFNRPYRVASRNSVASEIQIMLRLPYGTIRHNIRALNEKGYIEKPYQLNIGNHKGQTCRVNMDKCLALFGQSGIPEPVNRYAPGQPDNWATGQQVATQSEAKKLRSTGQQEPPIESSYYLLEKLTTERDFFREYFSGKFHLVYWMDHGLQPKNLSHWAQACNCDGETLLRYMDYCRFEMVELGREDRKTDTVSPIENLANYFWSQIKRAGYYPKPKGYTSPEEIQLRESRRALEQLAEKNTQLDEIARARWKQERMAEFLPHFQDPESDIYQKCFLMLNDFQKGRVGKNYESFKGFMFSRYLEIIGSEKR